MLLLLVGGALVNRGVDWVGLVDALSKYLLCLRKYLIYSVVHAGVIGAELRRIPQLIA